MAKDKIIDLTKKIVEMLTPFDSDDRQRVIKAALMLMGETPVDDVKDPSRASEGDKEIDRLPSRAQTWMRQNGVTLDELEQVFNIEDEKVEVIASDIPGKNDKIKTYNAYVLTGISQLLLSGDTAFDDQSARNLCAELGCYNSANHAAYMGSKSNKLTGSKEKGWKLTTPGLNYGVELVKEITKGK